MPPFSEGNCHTTEEEACMQLEWMSNNISMPAATVGLFNGHAPAPTHGCWCLPWKNMPLRCLNSCLTHCSVIRQQSWRKVQRGLTLFVHEQLRRMMVLLSIISEWHTGARNFLSCAGLSIVNNSVSQDSCDFFLIMPAKWEKKVPQLGNTILVKLKLWELDSI